MDSNYAEYKRIGQNIQTRRKARGMTQEKFAERIGIAAQYMSVIETGRQAASLPLLCKIAKEFGISLPRLISGT